MSREEKGFISGVMILVCLVCVMVGKLRSFHFTEGEALIKMWSWWAAAAISGVIAIIVSRKD